MADRVDWNDLRERRMAEPGVAEAYEAARLAVELGQEVPRPTLPDQAEPRGQHQAEPEPAVRDHAGLSAGSKPADCSRS